MEKKIKYNPLSILIEGSNERKAYEAGRKSVQEGSDTEIDLLEKWLVNKLFGLREKNREYKVGHGFYDELYIKGFEEVLLKIVTGK